MSIGGFHIPSDWVKIERLRKLARDLAKQTIDSRFSRHAQLLENDRLLLIVQDSHGNLFVFLETLARIDHAIASNKYKKQLHREKIGQDFILTFDEQKKMLALCSSTKACIFFSPLCLRLCFSSASTLRLCFRRKLRQLVGSRKCREFINVVRSRPKVAVHMFCLRLWRDPSDWFWRTSKNLLVNNTAIQV